jgi:uncharacterized membrane protein
MHQKRYTDPSSGSGCSHGSNQTKFAPIALDAPTIGALAHLYRGEIYRSTIWRTRLDNTTNWAVVTLGIALSVTFSKAEASPLPLLLAGILCIVFLIFEARRYRYFNVWRARARWIERNFYAPMLRGEPGRDYLICGRNEPWRSGGHHEAGMDHLLLGR